MHSPIPSNTSPQELSHILDKLGEGVLLTDAQHKVSFANPAACQALGVERPEGLALAMLVPAIAPYLVSLATSPQASLAGLQVEQSGQGETRHLKVSLEPRLDPKQSPIGFLVFIKDISSTVQDRAELRDQNARLEAIINGTRAGTWEWNVQTDQTRINERWAQMLGYTRAELEPMSGEVFKTLAHPDDIAFSDEKLALHFAGKLPFYEQICRLRHKDGHWVWVHDRGQLTSRDSDGHPLLVTGTHIDITESRLAEERLNKLAQSVPGVIYQYALDPDGHSWFPYASQGIRAIYGLSPQQVTSDASLVFERLHPDDAEAVADSIRNSARTLGKWHCQYRVKLDDRQIWVEGNAVPEKLEDGTILWHGIITDITERKHLEEQLRILSITDELTGLFNRRHLFKVIDDTFHQFQRYQTPFSLLLIDIDHFKAINDGHGHPVGDEVLKVLAALFGQSLRRTDVAGRIGGEEFLVLLTGTEAKGAAQAAQQLCQQFAALALDDGRQGQFSATLSIGVATVSADDKDPAALVKRADQAVYQAKRHGRNQVWTAD
ncbi:diguanylate cyclase [Gallaecimonas pentaromativorans]|uniref:sensor domain-containing diguanylate cyclase n=1 Tax=Gallaecimonas pentaromativorans TaxID=584787 RepID=UPI003A8D6562